MNTTIKIGGIDRKLRFGMYAMERMQEITGNGEYTALLKVLWGGLCNGSIGNIQLSIEEAEILLEELIDNKEDEELKS